MWNWSDVIITPQGLKIYGAEYLGGPKIDFTEQVGIYYLHKVDDDDLFACRGWIARSLGETLETHASNFFNGNYDRFTWFGLRPVLYGMMGPLPAFNPMTQQTLSLLVTKAFIPAEDMIDEDERAVSHLMMTEYIQSAYPSLNNLGQSE